MTPWLSPARPHLRNPLSCRSGWEPDPALHVLVPCSSQTPWIPTSVHGTSLEFSFPGCCSYMDVFSEISLSFLSSPKYNTDLKLELSSLPFFFILSAIWGFLLGCCRYFKHSCITSIFTWPMTTSVNGSTLLPVINTWNTTFIYGLTSTPLSSTHIPVHHQVLYTQLFL